MDSYQLQVPVDQPLVEGAQEARDHHPSTVYEERFGRGLHAIGSGHCGHRPANRVGVLRLGQILAGRGRRVLDVDPQEGDRSRPALSGGFEGTFFLPARLTPRGPEVEYDRPASERREAYAPSVQVLHDDVRGGPAQHRFSLLAGGMDKTPTERGQEGHRSQPGRAPRNLGGTAAHAVAATGASASSASRTWVGPPPGTCRPIATSSTPAFSSSDSRRWHSSTGPMIVTRSIISGVRAAIASSRRRSR